MDGCAQLAEACARVAARTSDPAQFLRELGHEAAGVRRGPRWPLDAGRGGSNRIRGRGFRRHVDDGTDGQARHFAGIVAVAARLGTRTTRWLSIHVGRDAPESADGRLTDHALDFVGGLRSGELQPADAADWVRSTICGQGSGLTSR
ncbi:hypothetical protein [Leifsonia shinshuensis]|uniref:hypothetical protein n=1 Tax=Leifsonia shinshuensis TaxID=150026 RepID=UPI002857578E|nr:hypothetical protein [Leifsonia shinshuensis]MDR6972565.1 hypothetical protein [Leifsonia shinshuensis]